MQKQAQSKKAIPTLTRAPWQTLVNPAHGSARGTPTLVSDNTPRLFTPHTCPLIQAKLSIGRPDDRYEQEADRVADQVLRMPDPRIQRQAQPEEDEERLQAQPLAATITPLVQRQTEAPEDDEAVQTGLQRQVENPEDEETVQTCVQRQTEAPEDDEEPAQTSVQRQVAAPEDDEEPTQTSVQRQTEAPEDEDEVASLQMKPLVQHQALPEADEEEPLQTRPAAHTPRVPPDLEAQIQALRGGGSPLSAQTRAFFEPRFGHDFSGVRVHSDARAAETARAVQAQAFTLGRDVVFGAGQYAPGTDAGRRLLGHELTHVVQQGQVQQKLHGLTSLVQRKLYLHSPSDAEAFKYFFTANDAAYFQYARAKGLPHEVTLKPTQSERKFEDAFRFRLITSIINHPIERLIIRGYGLDQEVQAHDLYENGKVNRTGIKPTLHQLGKGGAMGVTIPSVSLALKSNANYTGPVTGHTNESWIFYSSSASLAHEFGHAFLFFLGAPAGHSKMIPKGAKVPSPEGEEYEGSVNAYIQQYVEEQFTEVVLIDPGALHVSPTAVRKWPEPPNYKLTFTGTWIEFKKRYPGAMLKQEVQVRKGKKYRKLMVCIPKSGEICPP